MRRLLGELWMLSGKTITHPWDASSYLIKGDQPVLIDCGSSLGYPAMKRALAAFGYQPRDIMMVIGTHGHWDHLSGMAQLKAESDAKLFMHEGDREAVETGDYDLTAGFLYEQPFPPVTVDGLLHDADVLHIGGLDLTVIHTPGHTPGSICLLTEIDGERLLVAGDTIWGGWHLRVRSDIDVWRLSLDRLLEHDFDVLTFGHFPELVTNAHRKVENGRRMFGAYFDPWFRFEEAT